MWEKARKAKQAGKRTKFTRAGEGEHSDMLGLLGRSTVKSPFFTANRHCHNRCQPNGNEQHVATARRRSEWLVASEERAIWTVASMQAGLHPGIVSNVIASAGPCLVEDEFPARAINANAKSNRFIGLHLSTLTAGPAAL